MRTTLNLRLKRKYMLCISLIIVLVAAIVSPIAVSAEDPVPPTHTPPPPVVPEYLELELCHGGPIYEGDLWVHVGNLLPGIWYIQPNLLSPTQKPVVIEFGPPFVIIDTAQEPLEWVYIRQGVGLRPEAVVGQTYMREFAFEAFQEEEYPDGSSIGLGKQVIFVDVIECPGLCPEEPGSRTLGFYKNHPCVIQYVLDNAENNEIIIAGESLTAVEEVIDILKDRSTHESRLKSQLLTTILNGLVFKIFPCTLESLGVEGDGKVKDIVKKAEGLLLASEASKDKLSAIQDILDEINNSNTETSLPDEIADACPPGKDRNK